MIGYFIDECTSKKQQLYYTLPELLQQLFSWEDRLAWSCETGSGYQYQVKAETIFRPELFRGHIQITSVEIRRRDQSKVLISWKQDEDTKLILDTFTGQRLPAVIVSMSPRGVNILTDLSVAMFTTICSTKRMPKLLWVREGTTIQNILRNPQLTRWLPKDSSFDLDRQPPDQYIGKCGESWMVSIEDQFGEKPTLSYQEADNYRWIDWCAEDSWLNGYSSIAPFSFAPPDGAILAIPMKHVKDRAPREWTDDYRMMVQIRHRDKIPDTPPTAMERQNEMYIQFAKILKEQQSEKSE